MHNLAIRAKWAGFVEHLIFLRAIGNGLDRIK
jgi:hypothetical protein